MSRSGMAPTRRRAPPPAPGSMCSPRGIADTTTGCHQAAIFTCRRAFTSPSLYLHRPEMERSRDAATKRWTTKRWGRRLAVDVMFVGCIVCAPQILSPAIALTFEVRTRNNQQTIRNSPRLCYVDRLRPRTHLFVKASLWRARHQLRSPARGACLSCPAVPRRSFRAAALRAGQTMPRHLTKTRRPTRRLQRDDDGILLLDVSSVGAAARGRFVGRRAAE